MTVPKWIAIDPRHGTVLHILHEETEATRFGKHHERDTGDRPALLRWTPGRIEIVDPGALRGVIAEATADPGDVAGPCS